MQIDRQTDRQTNTETERDRQTDKETERESEGDRWRIKEKMYRDDREINLKYEKVDSKFKDTRF